jgi:hypothetical protein
MNDFKVTEELSRKVLEVVDAGLVSGMGEPTPGKMCVEAAVCYAMGLLVVTTFDGTCDA